MHLVLLCKTIRRPRSTVCPLTCDSELRFRIFQLSANMADYAGVWGQRRMMVRSSRFVAHLTPSEKCLLELPSNSRTYPTIEKCDYPANVAIGGGRNRQEGGATSWWLESGARSAAYSSRRIATASGYFFKSSSSHLPIVQQSNR